MPDLLGDVEVVELAGELTPYAGLLLAELGANVTLVELPGSQAPGVPPAPLPDGADGRDLYLHRGKRRAGAGELDALVARADVLLQSHEGGGAPALTPERARELNPQLVHALVTPFGRSGPRAGDVSTDLVRLAAGGLLWLGGYPDTEPVAVFGGQSTYAVGLFTAVAVLLALDGGGHLVEVSAQEVLTQALETSLADYELTGRVRARAGDGPREAGTGVFPCADGLVSMVAGRLGTAAAWTRLREWMVEARTPGAEELFGAEWEQLSYRREPEPAARFAELFAAFAATRTKQQLYEDAQARGIALAPVNSLADVLADPQLAARGFFAQGVPGAPFRFDRGGAARPAEVAPAHVVAAVPSPTAEA
jgi:benzylsuccinate CoA-transferase BbsE subunit